ARGRLDNAGFSLSTYPGGVEWTATRGLSGAWFGIWQAGWRYSSYDWGTPRIQFRMNSSSLSLGMTLATWTPPAHGVLGFGYESIIQSMAAAPGISGTHTLTRVAAPYWFLMLLSCTPSLVCCAGSAADDGGDANSGVWNVATTC